MENTTVAEPKSYQPQPSHLSLAAILRRRWWLIAALMVAAVAVTLVGSLTAPPVYRSSIRLQVVVLDDQEVTLYTRLPTAGAGEQIIVTQTKFVEVLTSPLIAWRTINDLELNMNADSLLDRLKVSVSSEFVTLSYEASTAQLAQDILSRQVENALAHYRSLQSLPAVTTGQFVEAEMEEQGQALAAAQESLLDFRLEHNVGDLLREINAMQDVLRGLEAGRDGALVEAGRSDALAEQWSDYAAQVEAEVEAMRERGAEISVTQPVSPTDEAAVPDIEALAAQFAALQEEIAQQEALAETYRATALVEAANGVAQRAGADRQEAIISQRKADLSQLIGLSSQYGALLTAVDSAQADFDFLRAKAVEARLKERQITDVDSLQVVEGAFLPDRPVPSPALRLALLAALISLLLGVGLALLWELVRPVTGVRESGTGAEL